MTILFNILYSYIAGTFNGFLTSTKVDWRDFISYGLEKKSYATFWPRGYNLG